MSARRSSDTVLPPEGVRPLPGVNLLPQETVQARDVASVRRLLLLGFVGFILLTFLVGAVLELQVRDAKDARQAETSRAARLDAQAAKYAEVPQLLRESTALNNALGTASSTDLHWKDYLDAMSAVMPPHMVVESLASTATSPVDDAPPVNDRLQPTSVATVTITAYASSLDEPAQWAKALDTIPGLADARVVTSTLKDATAGGFTYEATLTVQVTSDAYVAPVQIEVAD